MKRVALVNDISGIGRCSLGVALPILSCLGLQVSSVVTAVLTNQTSYPSFYKKDMDNLFEHTIKEWRNLGIKLDGCITGYFAKVEQVDGAKSLYNCTKSDKSILVVDPIMGEDGALYPSFDKNMCDSISKLTKIADIITPNFTEACILSGTDYHSLCAKNKDKNFLEIVADSFCALLAHKKAVVVTGIKDSASRCIYNLLITNNGYTYINNPIKNGTYSGTGDIFASLFGGLVIKGKSIDTAFEISCNFLNEAIHITRESMDSREGLDFELILSKLTNL